MLSTHLFLRVDEFDNNDGNVRLGDLRLLLLTYGFDHSGKQVTWFLCFWGVSSNLYATMTVQIPAHVHVYVRSRKSGLQSEKDLPINIEIDVSLTRVCISRRGAGLISQ